MIEVPVVSGGCLTREFAATPRIRNDVRMGSGIVFRLEEVCDGISCSFDQQYLAVGAERVDDFYIKGNFESPACIRSRIAASARLVHFFETAIAGRADRKAVLLAINAQITLNVGIVVGIDNGYGLYSASRRRQSITNTELHRAVTSRTYSRHGNAASISNNPGVTTAGAGCGWTRANWTMIGGERDRG